MISATVADATGGMQAWLAPGARIPLVFSQTNVVFTAGPTTYELSVHVRRRPSGRNTGTRTRWGRPPSARWSSPTRKRRSSWPSPSRCCGATAPGLAPSRRRRQAAARLGWPLTTVQPQAGQRLRQAGPGGRRRAARRRRQARHQPARPAGRARGDLPSGHPGGPAAARRTVGCRRLNPTCHRPAGRGTAVVA